MTTPVLLVPTEDAVPLTVPVAGLASRALAAGIDGVGAVVLAVVVAWGVPDLFTLLGALVAVPLVSEVVTGGRTPGKAMLRLRVVTTAGARPGVPALLLRNLLRLFDALPGTYAVGVVVTAGAGRRLGDLLAGTAVVEVPRHPALTTLFGSVAQPPAWVVDEVLRWDVSDLADPERQLLQAFLARRTSLAPHVRSYLGDQLIDAIRPRVDHVSVPPQVVGEAFLEMVLLRMQGGLRAG